MKALRFHGKDTPLALEDIPFRKPADDEVVVRVAGCGVCHTDIGFWRDGVPTKQEPPLTLGHEISGTVESAGPAFRHLVGHQVIVPAVIPCGRCELCRNSRGNACREQIMPGNDIDGGFAERVVVPARGLCPVKHTAGYELSELSVVADAVTTPYQAVVRSGLQAGGLAIVVGAGGVGGYCVQIAAARGAPVIAIDVDPARLALIADHGAAATIDASSTDFREMRDRIRHLAREWGCSPVGWKLFECSGRAAGQETAWGLLGPVATLVIVGFTLEKIEVRLSNLMAYDATAQGTWGCRPELYPEALELVTSGRITLHPFIERFPLEDGPEVLRRVADHEIERRAILVPGMN
ncbi:MAG: 6-hydroxycyclohex-1-ene-1-carbonyl-CoA dehydrogenase [Gemmatimonadales bacterium]